MSDYNPKPKPGYTKTGKSLKAVRRYYALKNADRQGSPKKSRDEEDVKRKSDDKLSKRIAVELKVQADANEKRSRRSNKSSTSPTPSTPIIVSPKETGPVFIAERPVKSLKSSKSIKSTKSTRSVRSIGTIAQIIEYLGATVEYGPFSLGCVFASALIGLAYIFGWGLMTLFDSMKEKSDVNKVHDGLPVALYLAVVSVFVVFTCFFWLSYRYSSAQALISLIVMLISTLCVGAYIIYASITKVSQTKLLPDQPNAQALTNSRAERDNLIFVLSITYFCMLLVSSGMMIKQVISLMYTPMKDRSKDKVTDVPQMSVFLAPQ